MPNMQERNRSSCIHHSQLPLLLQNPRRQIHQPQAMPPTPHPLAHHNLHSSQSDFHPRRRTVDIQHSLRHNKDNRPQPPLLHGLKVNLEGKFIMKTARQGQVAQILLQKKRDENLEEKEHTGEHTPNRIFTV